MNFSGLIINEGEILSDSFSGQMQRADQPPAPTTVITTMPPPTTRAYNGSGIDPWLISHDLLIAIDSGKKPDQNTWEKVRTSFDYQKFSTHETNLFNVLPLQIFFNRIMFQLKIYTRTTYTHIELCCLR